MRFWISNPTAYIEAARDRAQAALDDPSITLTTLERGFFDALKKSRSKEKGS